jgi:hypothetical protein
VSESCLKNEGFWNYLYGTAFKQRVEAIIEAFSAMNTNLDKEKNAITRMWASAKNRLSRLLPIPAVCVETCKD